MRKKKDPQLASPRRWRREARVSGEDKVVIELLTNGRPPLEKTTVNALTKDISPGGVRIMSDVSLPLGTLIKMEIALRQRRRLIQATGIVRWTRSVYEEDLFEMGVEFKDISPDYKMSLLEHTYRKRT
jgi:c-di-GMP-binding flagellar brake protein YcgR